MDPQKIRFAIRKVLDGLVDDHRRKLEALIVRAQHWVRLWDGKVIPDNRWKRWVVGQIDEGGLKET